MFPSANEQCNRAATKRFAPSSRARFKDFLRHSASAICSYSGIAPIWNMIAASKGIRILAYHGVISPPDSPFSVSIENFDHQMAHLKANFNVITLEDVFRYKIKGCNVPKDSIAITFDDGFKNIFYNALPILSKYRIPATLFIISGKMDGRDPRFMTKEMVMQSAENDLILIGSHSQTHRSIAQLSDADRVDEILRSKIHLEETLNRPVPYFCYPYGTFNDFDESSCRELENSGYALACTSVNGVNFRGTHPMKLRRTKVEWGDSMATFDRLLKGAMDPWYGVDYGLRVLQRPRAEKFGSL